MRLGILLASLLTHTAFACLTDSGFDNPERYRRFIADSCVYHGGGASFITSGTYKFFLINDSLIEGFNRIEDGYADQAFTEWMSLANFGNDEARYNVAVMLYRGIGVQRNDPLSFKLLYEVNLGSHYNTVESLKIRILQNSLKRLGLLSSEPDGDLGPNTVRAVREAQRLLKLPKQSGTDDQLHAAIIDGSFVKEDQNADVLAKRLRPGAKNVVVPDGAQNSMPATPINKIDDKRTFDERPPVTSEIQPRELTPDVLYKLREKSVHIIFSAPASKVIKGIKDLSQGSAVAISKSSVITNCHVIGENQAVVVVVNGVVHKGILQKSNFANDLCIVGVVGAELQPVVKMKKSVDIAIGEEAFAIGSPRGQENSLSAGIVSGKRKLNGVAYLQTTAPISPGSSGGALFDKWGNLIGITTMVLKDSQAINFAVAVDEFNFDVVN